MTDHRSSTARPGHDAGFTLIEVLVSITLLVIGIFGTLTVITQADHAETTAHKADVASQAAQRVINDLRSRDYRALAVRDSTVPLGSLSVNAGLDADSKTKLQSFYARDTTLSFTRGLTGTATRTVPATKIGGGSSDAQDPALVEERVDPADQLQGTRNADGAVVARAAPSYQVLNIPDGTGHEQRVHVFTRVTWRDVSCPVLDLTNPLGQVSTLLNNLKGLLAPSANGTGNSLYDILLGSQGSITKLLSSKDSLVTNLLTSLAPGQSATPTILGALLNVLVGDNGVLTQALTRLADVLQVVTNGLFSGVSALLAPVGQILSLVVQPLANVLDPLLNLVTGPLTKLTDLCDLNLVDDGTGHGLVAPLQQLLPALNDANTALAGLQQQLSTKNLAGNLIDAASNITSGVSASSSASGFPSCPVLFVADPCALVGGTLQLLQTLTRGLTSTITDTVAPIVTSLTSVVTGLPATLTNLVTTLRNLPTALARLVTDPSNSIVNTNKNTKRITVAVWPERNGALVGAAPQYFSTVVVNPKAALLSADQAG